MINPNAMKHLLPLSPSGEMENFFLATEQYAPELRNMCESFERDSGPICDGHRIVTQLTDGGRRGVPTVMLFKSGAKVASLVGAQSKSQLEQFLDQNA